jgi:hypothetical protein
VVVGALPGSDSGIPMGGPGGLGHDPGHATAAYITTPSNRRVASTP